MKLKVAASSTFPQTFLAALASKKTARFFINEVVIGALHVDSLSITPGGHFMQKPDLIIPYDDCLGVNVAFTMVSARWDRSTADFMKALDALMGFYSALIHKFVDKGTPVHILCALALDGETRMPDGSLKRLLDEKWERWIVAGKPDQTLFNPPHYRYDPTEFPDEDISSFFEK